MKIAIHQPQYLPWIGLLEKISQSEVFVFLDNVQFQRGGFQNRTLYSTNSGAKYMTIPVNAPNHLEDEIEIKDIKFAQPQNRIIKKHFETLRHRYLHSPGWSLIKNDIEELFLGKQYLSVCELIIESVVKTMKIFNVQTKLVLASSLTVSGRKDELVLDIVKNLGGTVYLSGQGAKSYLREDLFSNSGINVEYQKFSHPVYEQTHGGQFIEGCMSLDLYLEDPGHAMKYIDNYLVNRKNTEWQ